MGSYGGGRHSAGIHAQKQSQCQFSKSANNYLAQCIKDHVALYDLLYLVFFYIICMSYLSLKKGVTLWLIAPPKKQIRQFAAV